MEDGKNKNLGKIVTLHKHEYLHKDTNCVAEGLLLHFLFDKKETQKVSPHCLIELHILVNCSELHKLVNVVHKREYDGEQNIALSSKKCDLFYNSVCWKNYQNN